MAAFYGDFDWDWELQYGMLLGLKWDFVGVEFGGMRIENSWILNGCS